MAIGCDNPIDSHVGAKQFINGQSGAGAFVGKPAHVQQSLSKAQSASCRHSGAGDVVIPPVPSPPTPPIPPVLLELPLPPIPLEFDDDELDDELDDDVDEPVFSVLTSGAHPTNTVKETSVK